MRVILAGQKSFGAAVYDALRKEGHDIATVWAPTDRDDKLADVAHRDRKLAWDSHRTPDIVRELEADLFVAAHSHDFIGRESRSATKLGGVGYHPSLLPRHRGRDAVRWTVKMGDVVSGGTVYWLTDNVDGGPIAMQDWCWVPRVGDDDERVSALWRDKLFPMGVKLLVKTLREIEARVLVQVEQDEDHASWEPSWERPPLFRPELKQLGGMNGWKHVVVGDGSVRA